MRRFGALWVSVSVCLLLAGPRARAQSAAAGVASEPYGPRGSSLVVEEMYRDEELGWMLEGLRTSGVSDPGEQERIRELFRLAAAWFAGMPDPSAERIREYGERFRKAPTDDPMVHAILGAVRRGAFDFEEAGGSLCTAADGLPGSGYARHRAAIANQEYAEYLVRAGRKDEAARYFARCVDLFIEAASKRYNAAGARVVARAMASGVRTLPEAHAAALQSRLEEASGIDPWIAAYVGGRYEVRLAWDARGGGAVTITDSKRDEFERHIGRAERRFERAQELHPDRPEAALGMMAMALASGNDNHDIATWFRRARGAEFGNDEISRLMLRYLSPRSHGSHELMLLYGLECAASDRFDTNVPLTLADAIERICEERNSAEWLAFDEKTYQELRRVLLESIERPEHEHHRVRLRQKLAAAAALFGDRRELASQLGQIPPGSAPLRWLGLGRAELYGALARADRRVDECLSGTEEVTRSGDYRRADRLLVEAASIAGGVDDPGLRAVVRDAVANCGLLAGLAGGEWIDLLPRRDEEVRDLWNGWRAGAGGWSEQPTGVSCSLETGGAALGLAQALEPRWEMELDVRFDGAVVRPHGGVEICCDPLTAGVEGYAIMLWPDLDSVSIGPVGRGFTRFDVPGLGSAAHLRVHQWGRRLLVEVDGVAVFDGEPVGFSKLWRTRPLTGTIRLAGGAARDGGSVRFEHIRLRGLTREPELAGADAD